MTIPTETTGAGVNAVPDPPAKHGHEGALLLSTRADQRDTGSPSDVLAAPAPDFFDFDAAAVRGRVHLDEIHGRLDRGELVTVRVTHGPLECDRHADVLRQVADLARPAYLMVAGDGEVTRYYLDPDRGQPFAAAMVAVLERHAPAWWRWKVTHPKAAT